MKGSMILRSVGVVFLMGLLAWGCGSGDKKTKTESADGSANKSQSKPEGQPAGPAKPEQPEEKPAPAGPTKPVAELLPGKWEERVELDKDKLDAYLAGGGNEKGSRQTPEELRAKLDEILATKTTREFKDDGTVITTITKPGREPVVREDGWEVRNEKGNRADLVVTEETPKGKFAVVDGIVFESDDCFRDEISSYRGMPLKGPTYHRVKD